MTKVKSGSGGGPGQPSRRRGRPPRISREQIIEAALEVGLDNLSLKAVAERLGVHPTALNRHIRDRAGLDSQVAAAVVEFEMENLELDQDAGWVEVLEAMAHSLRRALLQQPAAALLDRLPEAGSVGSMRQLNEIVLRLQAADPAFDALTASQAIAFVGQVVHVSARDELLIREHGRHPLDTALAYEVATAGQGELGGLREYVETRGRIDPDAQFHFNLRCAIRGIAEELYEKGGGDG